MKKSKNLLLLATAMVVGTVSAENNPNVINIWDDFGLIEFSGNDANDDKNIFRQLARNCGNADFEMGIQVRFKPFKISQKFVSYSNLPSNLPKELAIMMYVTQEAAKMDQELNEALKMLLTSTDKNGKTALDLVRERRKATDCFDCAELEKSFESLKFAIENLGSKKS